MAQIKTHKNTHLIEIQIRKPDNLPRYSTSPAIIDDECFRHVQLVDLQNPQGGTIQVNKVDITVSKLKNLAMAAHIDPWFQDQHVVLHCSSCSKGHKYLFTKHLTHVRWICKHCKKDIIYRWFIKTIPETDMDKTYWEEEWEEEQNKLRNKIKEIQQQQTNQQQQTQKEEDPDTDLEPTQPYDYLLDN